MLAKCLMGTLEDGEPGAAVAEEEEEDEAEEDA